MEFVFHCFRSPVSIFISTCLLLSAKSLVLRISTYKMFIVKEFTSLLLMTSVVIASTNSSNTSSIAPSYARNASTGHGTITTTTQGSFTRAVLSDPPMQVYGYRLTHDIYDFLIASNKTSSSNQDTHILQLRPRHLRHSFEHQRFQPRNTSAVLNGPPLVRLPNRGYSPLI